MIQKKITEFGVEIRGRDREQIFQQRRRERKFECEIDEAQLQPEYFQLKNLCLLTDLFMDPTVSQNEQAQLLLAAIQFTGDDEHSHTAIKQLIQKEGLVEKLKESVYDENLPLKFRELSIQVLGQMLNSTFQLCGILISKGLIKFMVTIAKLSYQNKMYEFLIHSLTGISHLVGHTADVRNQMVEEQIDQLLLSILQCSEEQYKTKLYQKVGSILNNWFRDKLPQIPFQLFLDIGELVLQINLDEEYQDDVVWFFYQFAAQSLDQLKQDQCDEFIYKLLSLDRFHNFLTLRLLDYRSLGCVASVRLMIKLIRFSVVPDFVIGKFQNDLTTIFRKCVDYEINMMKIEALKLVNVMISKMPNTPFVKQEFRTLLNYFPQSPRIQEYVLNVFVNCDIHLLDEEQQVQTYQLCENILFSYIDDNLNKLIFSLKIILNLNLPELSYETLAKIEDLQYHKSKEIYELSYAIIQKYKK